MKIVSAKKDRFRVEIKQVRGTDHKVVLSRCITIHDTTMDELEKVITKALEGHEQKSSKGKS